MMHGYGLVKKLCAELKDFMKKHNFTSIEDFRGYGLKTDLVSNNLITNMEERHADFFLLLFLFLDENHRVSLQYFTTHTDLVQRQQEAIRQRKATRKGLQSDRDWTGDGFVTESESMVSN